MSRRITVLPLLILLFGISLGSACSGKKNAGQEFSGDSPQSAFHGNENGSLGPADGVGTGDGPGDGKNLGTNEEAGTEDGDQSAPDEAAFSIITE